MKSFVADTYEIRVILARVVEYEDFLDLFPHFSGYSIEHLTEGADGIVRDDKYGNSFLHVSGQSGPRARV
jgi:hypothetical protein